MCLPKLKIRVEIGFNLEKLFSNPLSPKLKWLGGGRTSKRPSPFSLF
jgi:hypothetical protein